MEEKELNVMKTWVSLRNIGDFPHQFELKYFPTPTWCKFCNLFIWGVASPQGYQCRGLDDFFFDVREFTFSFHSLWIHCSQALQG
jgi:hypothetical protein